MSWRFYEVLSPQPNFAVEPEVGLGAQGRLMVEMGQSEAWGKWKGDTALAFGFTWHLADVGQLRTFRDFLNRLGGKAGAFFIPSWTPDLTLNEAADTGATMIRIAAAGISDIVENRPDTPGRQIFIVTADGQFQPVGITSAALVGDQEELQLDFPLAFDIEPATTIIGKLHLVRLADDRAEYNFSRPGTCDLGLRMTTKRITRRVNEQIGLDGDDLFGLRAFVDCLATDENPEVTSFRTPTALGPLAYGAVPPVNFQTLWDGRFDGLSFIIHSSLDDAEVETDLFDDVIIPAQVTFAFDAGGFEFVAWQTVEKTIKLGFFLGGVATELEFPGQWPVAFNTYEIDGTAANANECEGVLFYLKDGYSSIFARFYREDFLTEHVVVRSPTAPIALYLARSTGPKIELVGMDAGHRRAIWRAGDYLPPLPSVFGRVSLDPTVTIDYLTVEIESEIADSGTVSLSETVIVEYESITVGATAPAVGARLSVSGGVAIEYEEIRVYSDSGSRKANLSLNPTIPLVYVLVAKNGTATTKGNVSLNPTITIGYAP